MRRRHLESVSAALYGRCQASFVSSRSLSVRGSWGTAPSVFWYGAPGGTQGPPGKGGAAERWRVTPSVSGVTRHGAQPAMTRTHKRNASAASRTGCHPPVTPPRRRRLPTRYRRRAVLTMPLQKAFAARRPQTIPHIRKVFLQNPSQNGARIFSPPLSRATALPLHPV